MRMGLVRTYTLYFLVAVVNLFPRQCFFHFVTHLRFAKYKCARTSRQVTLRIKVKLSRCGKVGLSRTARVFVVCTCTHSACVPFFKQIDAIGLSNIGNQFAE